MLIGILVPPAVEIFRQAVLHFFWKSATSCGTPSSYAHNFSRIAIGSNGDLYIFLEWLF